MEDIVILIPTYKPNIEIMRTFINDVIKVYKNVVIVNDGSGKEFDSFFEELEKLNITVLRHEVNRGKGRAIKTGFKYILEKFTNISGTITADCDGQHTISDIEKCADALRKNNDSLIVGCRNFKTPQTPLRSKFGNNLTRLIFLLFIGINISDTQTGLRAFSTKLMNIFLNTAGERYEYETNMLIECKKYGIEIEEVPIQTIYIEKNASSHFNPIKDSIIIYKLFLKYVLTALSSFLIDIGLFCILINFIDNIMFSTVIARIISTTYNFITNSKLVFKTSSKKSIIKYLFLALVQMMVSGLSVSFITKHLNINAPIVKIIIDSIIFVANFIIQREWVFKG